MPANSRENNFFGTWPRSNYSYCEKNGHCTMPNTPNTTSWGSPNSRHSPPITYPSSPISVSPSTSPHSTLRRNYSSTFMLIPEDREIDHNEHKKFPKTQKSGPSNLIVRLILWWPLLMLDILYKIFIIFLRILFIPFSFATPTFWLSAILWIFWKLIGFPLSIIKWILYFCFCTSNGYENSNKRTILISCGSTIQTLHLARNFYSSGARVIVFEFDGLFGLARFSTAVNKFYTVPRPTPDDPHEYIAALCDIVRKEKATYYIPVCATSPSYYDTLVKPHLELLGCCSFIPSLQENSILDDTLALMKKCELNRIKVPQYKVLSSKEDLLRLYDAGDLSGYRNLLMAVGTHGILERQKYVLPKNRRDLKFMHEINEDKQWLLIPDLPGNHYITCTTIRDSRVVANVICLVNQNTKNLKPEENKEIENWLIEFFNKIRSHNPVNGHICFRFVKCAVTKQLLPLGSRIGVSLSYICYTSVHSRVLWKPCPHFSRQNSGPLIQQNGRYWIHDAILNTLKRPSMNAFGKLIGTVLDKREVLFVYWDPLPYCAYYHFQLPLKSVKLFLQKRQKARSMASTLSAPVY